MEEHKVRYLLRLLGSRTPEKGGQAEELMSQVHHATLLEDLEEAMRELEQKTRRRYSEAFDIDSNDFVQMMVIDGCFVLELLRLYHKFEKEKNVDDPIFATRWMLRTLQRDLLKLENQLPFFVLEKLFELITMAEDPPLIDLVLTFFDPLLPRKNIKGMLNPEGEFDHMLEVFRSTFLSSLKQNITPGSEQLKISVNIPLVQERQLVHSVTELEEAGVELKKREDCDLLDISFQGGVLKIPPLYIDDNTAPLFLNFVAYEQCEDGKPFFTNFLMFFESLINSSADVEILHKNGIINHVLGSDQDVADLFNKLGREVVYDLDECYLSQQIKGVNNYCKAYYASKWRVWFTNLKHDYFSSPWTFFSLLAAIALLLLTTAQTYYTVYAYYMPS
ncbi:hypothetical protein PVL29_025937 [Vitis rotundifolia]|uniref:Uncharacterized protein n=1 Tax=Vitis rotundifolia TaxID=103349 RepID=A0AA38YLB0_VITRO|nr:hypothetical protein PVL29_025937 [Vitis rotundifolia]